MKQGMKQEQFWQKIKLEFKNVFNWLTQAELMWKKPIIIDFEFIVVWRNQCIVLTSESISRLYIHTHTHIQFLPAIQLSEPVHITQQEFQLQICMQINRNHTHTHPPIGQDKMKENDVGKKDKQVSVGLGSACAEHTHTHIHTLCSYMQNQIGVQTVQRLERN